MKKGNLLSCSVIGLLALAACGKDDVDNGGNGGNGVKIEGQIACLLTQGHYTGLPGSLNVIDMETSEVQEGVFQRANGRTLGNTPQCGVVYGSKIYIGMSDSKTIEVIDKSTFKSMTQLRLENAEGGRSPRSMVATGGKVYIAMYEGYVARLDTVSLEIDASIKVGPNPEKMCLHKGKLYVPNSDGMNYPDYGTTASIVTLHPFAEEKQIEVPMNPSHFMSDGENLYLLSRGNYGEIPSALYAVKETGNEHITLATDAAYGDHKILMAYNPYVEGGSQLTYKILDTESGIVKSVEFAEVPAPSALGIDNKTGQIILTSYQKPAGVFADYESPGFACEYDRNLKFVKKYNIGIGPVAIFFNDQE